jgi:hypothetical protein
MDGRLRFVARLLDGEAMSEVSRVRHFAQDPGYKIFERYKEHGLKALTDSAADPPIISIIGAAAHVAAPSRLPLPRAGRAPAKASIRRRHSVADSAEIKVRRPTFMTTGPSPRLSKL